MATNLEQIKENIAQLPPVEFKNLKEWINDGEPISQNGDSQRDADEEKFKRALEWIDEHREEYDGQLVVLEGDKLIAHGTDAKALYAAARARGIKSPFVERVRAKVLPFGGW